MRQTDLQEAAGRSRPSVGGQQGWVLTGARLARSDGVVEAGVLAVHEGVITAVGTASATSLGAGTGAAEAVDLGGGWVLPGFVDLHCHGGGGAAYADGAAAAATAAAFHLCHGTTTAVASLVTDAPEEMLRSVVALRDLVDEGRLAGVHLEGPFLSPARRGAHPAELLRGPDLSLLARLLEAGQGAVRMVTVAPELDGALDAIAMAADAGVLAAVGHTDADFRQTLAAVDAGARVATHLFNGMRPFAHRDPGPVAALLESEEVTVELIADGHHLDPAVLRLVTRSWAPGRTAFVTDAIAASGCGDGNYRLGQVAVAVRDGISRVAGGSSIAGSTATGDVLLRSAVAAGLSVPEAVRALSLAPARALGVAHRTGSLDVGRTADLVVLDDDLHVRGVMRSGAWVGGAVPR